MKYVFQLAILILFSLSCSKDQRKFSTTKIGADNLKYKTVHFDEKYRFNGSKYNFSFVDIEASDKGHIFGLDQNSGAIVKIENDKPIKKTGGIGRGPNEFDMEAKPSLLICNESYLLAFELKAARYQVYDLDLNYVNTILLDAIPEEIICYSQDEIAVFYHIKEGIDIMRFDGNLISRLKFVEDWSGNNLTFKEVIYSNKFFFISYMFDPRLAIYKEGFGTSDLITLPVKNQDSVKFATKNISKSGDDVHLYFYDDHPSTPKAKRKKGHVFSNTGRYSYSYQIPEKINYYKFFSQNELIAVEDTLQRITIYNFTIDE